MKRTTMESAVIRRWWCSATPDPEKVADTIAAVQIPQRRLGLHLADAFLCAGAAHNKVPRALHRIRQGHRWRRSGAWRDHSRSPTGAGFDAMQRSCRTEQRGGKIVAGGKAARQTVGYFFEPTVITDLPDDAKLMTEELFGSGSRHRPVQELRRRWSSAPIRCRLSASHAFTHLASNAAAIGEALQRPAWSASTQRQ